MQGENSHKNKPSRYDALVVYVCTQLCAIKSTYADPVKPAARINSHRLQCFLGGLSSDGCKL